MAIPCFAATSPCLNFASTFIPNLTSRPISSRTMAPRFSRLPVHQIRCEVAQNENAAVSEERMKKTIDSAQNNFNTVRTGRPSTAILDRILVPYYGAATPLNQIASLSISGTSTIVVEPYDKNALDDIERAILQSDIGINPNSDGSKIRLSVPPLSGERRKELVKQIKTMSEEARISIRNIRRDAVDILKKKEKKRELGKDESKTMQDEIQKLTDRYVKRVDQMFKQKEADITKV